MEKPSSGLKISQDGDNILLDLTGLVKFPVVVKFGELTYILVKSAQGKLMLNRHPLS